MKKENNPFIEGESVTLEDVTLEDIEKMVPPNDER